MEKLKRYLPAIVATGVLLSFAAAAFDWWPFNRHGDGGSSLFGAKTTENVTLSILHSEALTFLVTEYGKPFTPAGFGGWFRARCDEAGLRQCSAHGLRKAGAVRAAENGATTHELMAIFGWLSLKEAERYTQAARRRRLARNATRLLGRDPDEA